MSQKTTGLYRLTQISGAYEIFQLLLGADRWRKVLAEDYICVRTGDRVLDLGCGPASILPILGEVDYTGIDANADHIASATARYGARGKFIADDFACLTQQQSASFDLVLCLGLLHHLEDERVTELARLARTYLKPSGRFVAVDPVFENGQHGIARWLATRDAGQCVRYETGYRDLVGAAFGRCVTKVRHNLLHVPYSHCITMATAG
jgi:SAM-dependent methyltransferase